MTTSVRIVGGFDNGVLGSPMYLSSLASATPIQIVGYGGLPAAATAIRWCSPAAVGAVAAKIVGYGGVVSAPVAPPANVTAPVIAGTPQVGQTLTLTSPGTWTNSPTSYDYQWLNAGGPVAGATSPTYVIAAGDVGSNMQCRVRATNGVGTSASAYSNSLGPVTMSPPVNTVAPVASGALTVGSTLSVTNGTWSGSPTFTYQWQRGGVNISGATASTYTTVSADGGTTVACVVTGTNAGGSSSVASNGLAITVPAVTTIQAIARGRRPFFRNDAAGVSYAHRGGTFVDV